ncbi:SET domain-containing protein [Athelia psychrophila]|uniref:SET domain-containing protein n=1 Tax=Athelia psychrophila TaxID=1759441 RepID=A0A166AVJ8_9AGAM|nr:SET domain-containing protein [Fibularhizoctonia sp. CBS 109695]
MVRLCILISVPLFNLYRKLKGAGNGLFASRACPPTTKLFTIPAQAMINVKTLAPHYPREFSQLSATQWVSLHMCLHRPPGDDPSPDPLFGAYISVLPRDFASHPVVWMVKQDLRQSGFDTELLDHLPPTTLAALKKVCSKFWEDWDAVCKSMSRNPEVVVTAGRTGLQFIPENASLCMDFRWAWLNVNTRCIYYQVHASRSSPDNLTMCPILDFANHTSTSRHMSPVPIDFRSLSTLPRGSPKKGQLVFVSPREAIEEGEEIFLCYGAHANRTLFVEYGFVNDIPIGAEHSDEYNGEVDVQDIVERLFTEAGPQGMWLKGVLEDNAYWGDWTLHASPRPAYPSFRLIAALRLYHLTLSVESTPESTRVGQFIEPWQDTLLGRKHTISDENEAAWRATLYDICQEVGERAKCALERLESGLEGGNASSWSLWMKKNICALWTEEQIVAAAVAASVAGGEQY